MVFFNKWITFTAGFYLQLCGGICYTFSLYSNSLKTAFNLDQPRLQGIASGFLASGLLGWVPGLVYNSLQKHPRFGPKLTAYLGTICHFVAYFSIFIAAQGLVYIPYWAIILLSIIAGSNIVWMDLASIATSIRNFPQARGHVAGIHKAFLGLSASLCSSIFSALFASGDRTPVDFILFLALFPVGVCLFCAPLLNHVPFREAAEVDANQRLCGTSGRFGTAYLMVGSLAAYQLAVAIVSSIMPLSDMQRIGALAGTLVLAGACAVVPIGAGSPFSKPASSLVEVNGESALTSPLLNSASGELVESAAELEGKVKEQRRAEAAGGGSGDGDVKGKEVQKGKGAVVEADWVAPELHLGQCMCSLQFWLLFVGLTIGMGAGFTFLSNIGQFAPSVGGTPAQSAVLVSLFSIFSCAGRMAFGFGSERMLHKYGTPRTLFFVANSALTAAVCALTAFSTLEMMYVAAAVGGFAFGGFWSLMPLQTSELFGLKYFASNNSVMYLSPTIASFAFATSMAGTLYEREAARTGADPGTCDGSGCFEDTFLILAGLNIANVCLSLLNYWRTRAVYRGIHLSLQHKEVA